MNRTHTTLTLLSILSLAAVNGRAGEVEPIKPEFTDSIKEQLAEGEIVLFYPKAFPPTGGFLAGAIHIDATRDEAWDIVSKPNRMPEYLGIKSCEILEEEKGVQRIKTVTEFEWLPIEWNYEYQATHEEPETVRFEYIKGNLRHFEGHWRLWKGEDLGLKGGSVVFYELYLDPGKLVPKMIVRSNLKKDVPNVLKCLKTFLESGDASKNATLAAAAEVPEG
jgi:hypothetical protein